MTKKDLKIGDSFIINKNFAGGEKFIGKKQVVCKLALEDSGVFFSEKNGKGNLFCYFTSLDLIQDNGNYEIY